jgi:2,5-furandicarboxylate decarboxylase 1
LDTTETGIDLVSPSDMRLYYQRCLDQGKPLEIAVAIGCHPYEMLAASYKAPIDLDEYWVAGGLHGWTADEGPFGEFSQISGDVKWNPLGATL